MFGDIKAFSGFSVDDIDAARTFYRDTLGLAVEDNEMGFLNIRLATGGVILVYSKDDHVPATYTILNFPVPSVDDAVSELNAREVVTKIYEGDFTDSRGVARPEKSEWGPTICWFKDPAGNVLSVLED